MAKAFVIKCPKCHDGTLIFDTWQRLCCDRCASYLRCVSCNSNDIRHQLLNGEYVFDCKVCRTTFGLPAKPKSVKSTPREIDFKVKPDFSGSTSFMLPPILPFRISRTVLISLLNLRLVLDRNVFFWAAVSTS